MSEVSAIVLAAGRSRRMQSARTKVLHLAAGRPLIHYCVAAAFGAGARRAVVVVSPGDRHEIAEYLARTFGDNASVAVQDPPQGTGHAAMVGLEGLAAAGPVRGHVLLLCGDTPLLTPASLQALLESAGSPDELRLGTCRLSDPSGYGRVLRKADGGIDCVREDRDLQTDEERAVQEVSAGLYCAPAQALADSLQGLPSDNAQGERYLPGILGRFARGAGVAGVALDPDVILGVNNRVQLAEAQAVLFRRIADRHRLAGATVADSARIDDGVQLGRDVTVLDGAQVRGSTKVAEGAHIDVGCVLEDAEVGPGARLLPYSVVSGARIGPGASIGPFTHVRPGTELAEGVKLGNFVEVKNSRLAQGVKAGHLSYIGDGDVGAGSNLGAGTIFCNYDGFSKQRTTLGQGVFVGSASQLIAPVVVGDGAYVATATAVTEDVPADALAVGRSRQTNKAGYAQKLRARLAAKKG